jgi:5'-nucleotidase
MLSTSGGSRRTGAGISGRARWLAGFRLRRHLARAFGAGAIVGCLAAFSVAPSLAQQPDAIGAPRSAAPLTLLQINDVYSTLPVDGLGGLARVATLKQQIAAAGRTPLLVLAGDFLSSSVASTVFKGEQMIAALNAAGLDVATLGNHEFDFGVDVLLQRMAEANWQWVVSNVFDRATERPIGGAAPYLVRTFGDLKVGFLGLCLTSESISREKLARIRLVDPIEAAATYLPRLRAEGAEVIVAVTHLSFAEDRALAERFPEIDVILGGHEHFPISATSNRTLISKAGTEARFVARIDVNRGATGLVDRFYELVPVTAALRDDPATLAVVHAYESRLGAGLDIVVGRAGAPLDGRTLALRTSETNLGNLVADAARAAAGAETALVNSGGIRGDRVLPAGPLTRRALLEIHPFGNVVSTVLVPGRDIVRALDHAVSRLPEGAGQFPQVSGLRFRVDLRAPPGDRVRDARIGDAPIDPDRVYTLAIPDYVLLGGDGYDMFATARVQVGPESGPPIVKALEDYLAARSAVAPSVEGRIIVTR